MTDHDERDAIARYLLGRSNDAERAAIEERYFQDESFFALIEGVADDLADAYVRKDLSADDRRRFETHCLGSADDNLRLRFAGVMRRHVATQAPTSSSWWASWLPSFDRAPGLRFAVTAAAVVGIVGTSFLSWRMVMLQSELRRVEGEAAIARGAVAAANEQSQSERTRRETLERQLNELSTASFVLIPGLQRGGGSELQISRDASFIRFELALEQPAASGRYRVLMRTVDRATVWSQEVVLAGPGASAAVVVTVPAAVVGPGQYELTLERIEAGGSAQLATYAIRIVQR